MARRLRLAPLLFVTLTLGSVQTVPRAGAATTGMCGVERWSVKTGTDPDAGMVDQSQVSPTSVGYLGSLPPPASPPANGRVRPVETTEYSVTATLTDYVMEDDSDYHLVLADPHGRTMRISRAFTATWAGTSSRTASGADYRGTVAGL